VEFSAQEEGSTRVFSFGGKFSFADNDDIRRVIDDIGNTACSSCTIDLSNLESIDSAGLGMLLLISDSAQEKGKSLDLRGAGGQVQKMLEISKFSEILTIKE